MSLVSPDLLVGITYAINAREAWEYMKKRFYKANRMRLYQLHREINALMQGTDSVATYFTKLKGLWNKYYTVIPASSSDFRRSKDYADHFDQMRLLQFL